MIKPISCTMALTKNSLDCAIRQHPSIRTQVTLAR